MTLVDTSVWVEYLRGTDSPSTRYVRERLGSDLFTTEPVLMELLAGARHGASTARLERLLLSQSWARRKSANESAKQPAGRGIAVESSTGHMP